MDAMPTKPMESSELRATCEKTASVALAANRALERCRSAAKRGDLASLLHLALRSLSGLGTPVNNELATMYLKQAVSSQGKSSKNEDMIATAHALLLKSLGVLPKAGLPCPEFEAFCEAEIHAAEAVRMRPGKDIPVNVMLFCSSWQRVRNECPGIFVCDDLWAAVKARQEEIHKEDERIKAKREANPNRYRCAARGCGIVAVKGKSLKRCAGKCEEEYKPYYCAIECQKKDWTQHKEFCKPGVHGPATVCIKTDTCPDFDYEFAAKWQGRPEEEPQKNLDVILPIIASDGKTFRVKGQRDALKGMKIERIPVEEAGKPPEYRVEIISN
ncbi:hypothetical protein Hypma_002457 [Hypsizygus marmoreus]|uniref:MYND-type domain-containing protein n=1 Tax=Hypsizygus marmoreus TaxID=39966 RepID=A0A369J8N1_HYPMA|nr:hypothetical protein Hypma_002457 [Hypsizygus marmoreus]